MTEGVPFVLHGFKSLALLDENNQPRKTYSIAAGLDYAGVGPVHAYLQKLGRCEYHMVDKDQTVDAFLTLSKTEGIIPALESSHAIAHVIRMGKEGQLKDDDIVLINISGRGDKDVQQIYELLHKDQ